MGDGGGALMLRLLIERIRGTAMESYRKKERRKEGLVERGIKKGGVGTESFGCPVEVEVHST